MKRLILLHSIGYFACFALASVTIALLEMSEPSHVYLQLAAEAEQQDYSRGEDALSNGLSHYLAALELERGGFGNETVTDLLRQSQDHFRAAIAWGLPRSQKAEAHYLLGDSFLHGDLDPVKAEQALDRALAIDPRHHRAARSLARSFSLMGLALMEARAWERVLAVMPEDAAARKAAALAYFRSPIPDRVERAYDHACVAARLSSAARVELAPIFDAAEGPFLQPAEAEDLADIIDHGPSGKLSDDEAERYAEEIGKLVEQR
ncbi:MAG: hypothetical protein HY303_15785 [Candidatus Wallbacteria bacterium]|nr:hypothetical protein [Candidatus Wallbacteria bacterium]